MISTPCVPGLTLIAKNKHLLLDGGRWVSSQALDARFRFGADLFGSERYERGNSRIYMG